VGKVMEEAVALTTAWGPKTIMLDPTPYEAVRTVVCGHVERVPLGDSGMLLWVHEEGKLLGLPVNKHATALWEKYWGPTDVVVGDAVVTGDDDIHGNTVPLTDAQIAEVLTVWR